MKKRNEKRKPGEFGKRLLYLYQLKGFDTESPHYLTKVAKEIEAHDPGRYDSDDQKTRNGKIKNTHDTLYKHIYDPRYDSAKNISGMWLNIYCKYFACSCDYLMGYISNPTHENSDIHMVTGLNDKAIALLKYRKENENKINFAANLSMINAVLCSSGFDQLIAGIYNYIYLDYNVPVFHTGKETEIDGNPYLEMEVADKFGDYNLDAEKYLLHFAKDKNAPYDYTSVVVDKDFLETVATDKIKKALDIIKADTLDKQKRGLL